VFSLDNEIYFNSRTELSASTRSSCRFTGMWCRWPNCTSCMFWFLVSFDT